MFLKLLPHFFSRLNIDILVCLMPWNKAGIGGILITSSESIRCISIVVRLSLFALVIANFIRPVICILTGPTHSLVIANFIRPVICILTGPTHSLVIANFIRLVFCILTGSTHSLVIAYFIRLLFVYWLDLLIHWWLLTL